MQDYGQMEPGELLTLPEIALTSVLSQLNVEDLLTVGRTCRSLQVLSNDDQLWMLLCQQWENEVNLAEWRRLVRSAKALFRLLRCFSKIVGLWSARQLYPRGGILHFTWGKGSLVASHVLPKGANFRGAQLFQQSRFVRMFELVGQPDGSYKAYMLSSTGELGHADVWLPGFLVWASSAKNCFHFQLTYPGWQHGSGHGNGSWPSVERQPPVLEGNEPRAHPRLQAEDRRLVDSLHQRFLLPSRAHGPDRQAITEGPEQNANSVGQRAIWYLKRLAVGGDNSNTCYRAPKTEYSKLNIDKSGPGKELTGLWSGVFGPHGLEVAQVCYTDQEIVATKILGDPNVPCGEATFKVALDTETADIPDSTRTSVGDLMSAAMNGAAPPELVKMYRGHGRIADHNFSNPKWVNGRLLVDSTGNMSFLWEVGRFLVLFRRFELDDR